MNKYTLLTPALHGDFTVGQSYARISEIPAHSGNGGHRGFYWDNTGMVRMLPVSLFSAATDEVWSPPALPRYLKNAERVALGRRIGVDAQSVYNWQRAGTIRMHDLMIGSELPVCNDPITDLKSFVESHGFYIQELCARWDSQRFGITLKKIAAERPAYFWDLWRGMLSASEVH